jgi:hypothetical protein
MSLTLPYITLATFNQIFEDIADRHPMINSYYFGTEFNIGATSSPVYPYMAILPNKVAKYNGGKVNNPSAWNSKEMEFDMIIMDKINKSDPNYIDTISLCEYISDTVIGEITNAILYNNIYMVIKSIKASYAWEGTIDNANGVRTTITFEVIQASTPCNNPQAPAPNIINNNIQTI